MLSKVNCHMQRLQRPIFCIKTESEHWLQDITAFFIIYAQDIDYQTRSPTWHTDTHHPMRL